MTAGERLRLLAGHSGTAAALLLAIGTGVTAGAALVDYSQLPTGTAAQHLLVDHVIPVSGDATDWQPGVHGGGGASNGQPVEIHDWRSVDALFKSAQPEQQKALLAAQIAAEDEIAINAIMCVVLNS